MTKLVDDQSSDELSSKGKSTSRIQCKCIGYIYYLIFQLPPWHLLIMFQQYQALQFYPNAMLCNNISFDGITSRGLPSIQDPTALSRMSSIDAHSSGISSIALVQAGVSREDMNYITANATSTPARDIKDDQVHCFGNNLKLRVNSTKLMIGHLLGASDAMETVATLRAIQIGWIHLNINMKNLNEGVGTSVMEQDPDRN
ncbi:hypothetical protein V6N13_088963 [Hibiscus sabdariffa]